MKGINFILFFFSVIGVTVVAISTECMDKTL